MKPTNHTEWLLDQDSAQAIPVERAGLLAEVNDLDALSACAGAMRDIGHGDIITYSPKVFIPLTQLCRNVCHYCTFAKTPRHLDSPYLALEQVLEIALAGARAGCHEALFTLGDKPELRYKAAATALQELGHETTVSYLIEAANAVLEETGLLPHTNSGIVTCDEMLALRRVSASQGLMLENISPRLCARGAPHFGSPDKEPERRLEMLRQAGESTVPFTTGLLIGIGETRMERIESLLAIRELHERYGHIQEVIIQNFRAKPDTVMARAPEPSPEELMWTIAVARLILGPGMSIQAPPNLSKDLLPQLIAAGVNDWGGVSPVTRDHVNPEAPWPHLDTLERETARTGKTLAPRLTAYPGYVMNREHWFDPAIQTSILRHSDSSGLARDCQWIAGEQNTPARKSARHRYAAYGSTGIRRDGIARTIDRIHAGERPDEAGVIELFQARGSRLDEVCHLADELRAEVSGNEATYVVTRNINYTNVCYFRCGFCAFSKGRRSTSLRGQPYDLSLEEIGRRTREAWERGATEICMQGGIHPSYTGQTYLDILKTVKQACPEIHVHAFSPLEIWQGSQTLGLSVEEYLSALHEAGLSSLPGTAAEILDDEVRAIICPDKLKTAEWLEIVETAHRVGLRTTSTIMFGHADHSVHWARHLLRLRDLQERTGGITEFVPLPFIHMAAPLYIKGNARKGPTLREALLMHAVSRLVLHPLISNIQVSWVKMGREQTIACLRSGANDLGGTLMNESISRAAGTEHGQEMPPEAMDRLAEAADRIPRQRTTLYGKPPIQQIRASYQAQPLSEPVNTPIRWHRNKESVDKSGFELAKPSNITQSGAGR